MMKKRKNGWMRKGIMAMVSALTIVASAGTVLAYEPLQSSDESLSEIVSDSASVYLGYEFDDCEDSKYDWIASLDFSNGDIFVYLDGSQVQGDYNNSTKALCKHNMKDGHLYRHESNGTGGCTVKVYTCQRCTRCGYLANAKYQYTVTYTKCPH